MPGNRKDDGARPGRRGPVRDRRRAERPPRAESTPPLERFSPERLALLLELALTPDELVKLCRKVGVQARGGWRLEKLSPVDHAQLLADEYAAEKRARPPIEEMIVEALKEPALRTLWLTPGAASEIAQLVAGDPVTAEARLAWRFIGDGDPAVRAAADQAIDQGIALLESYEDAAQAQTEAPAAAVTTTTIGGALQARLDEVEKKLGRSERDREAARAQLQQARAEIAERDGRINELKTESTRLRVEGAAHLVEISKLQAAQSTDERRGGVELRKLVAEKNHLEGRFAELEERLDAEKRRAAELERQLADKERPALNQPPGEPAHQEPPAHEFVVPLFTDEFYESLERWDRRVVKVAFEKALLLAKDRRHPSLRALPLEGVENLFRIRIASDVRLIYRRSEDGRLEILSLIDREDLDRYVRQAKTR